jgi:hypothetical protein
MAAIEVVTWKKHNEGSAEFVDTASVPAAAEVVMSAGIRILDNAEVLVLGLTQDSEDGKVMSTVSIPKSAIITRQFKDHTQLFL